MSQTSERPTFYEVSVSFPAEQAERTLVELLADELAERVSAGFTDVAVTVGPAGINDVQTQLVDISAWLPAAQVHGRMAETDALCDWFAERAHELLADAAIVAGRQSPSDCGDVDGPGCEGCNVLGAGQPGERPATAVEVRHVSA